MWACFGKVFSPLFVKPKYIVLKKYYGPGWCGSADWAPDCEPKGPWFDSQSGHMPGLQAGSPVRGTQGTATHWCFSPFLSPSLPLSLKKKINKIFFKNFLQQNFFKKKYYACIYIKIGFEHIFEKHFWKGESIFIPEKQEYTKMFGFK